MELDKYLSQKNGKALVLQTWRHGIPRIGDVGVPNIVDGKVIINLTNAEIKNVGVTNTSDQAWTPAPNDTIEIPSNTEVREDVFGRGLLTMKDGSLATFYRNRRDLKLPMPQSKPAEETKS